MNRLAFACTLFAGWAAGCGAAAPADETTSTVLSPIQGGTIDTTHSFAVGVVQVDPQKASICTGTLLAPNLVATARHCVAQVASSQIDCATSVFGAPVATSQMFVTTDATIGMTNHSLTRVASIVVPSGSDQTKVCGNDIALLILASNVTLPLGAALTAGSVDWGQYVTPVIAPPMTDHETYSTSVTAIGYGVDTPTDTQGASAGTRRIKGGIPLTCIPNDKTFVDCFSDPQTAQLLTSGEFISGNASTCEGDSGSNAYDQKNFSNGKWVSFGVLSRGGVSMDGMTCADPIYTRFDAWGPLLIGAAEQAASMGGYIAPAWAVSNDGASCSADEQCSSKNCVVVGSTSNAFVCASPCTANACAAPFECNDGFCFAPGSPNAAGGLTQSQPMHSGGCILAAPQARASEPQIGFMWVTISMLVLARHKRRRLKQLSGSGQQNP